jgi:hypothetical protein
MTAAVKTVNRAFEPRSAIELWWTELQIADRYIG